MSPLLVHERKLGIMIKKLLLTTVLTALFSSLGWAKHSDRVVDVGTAKQLFVDDDVIRSMERAYRVLNQPVKYEGNPVLELKPEQKVGGQDLVVVMGNVSYDAEEQIFKMWYDAAVYDWSKVFLGYATSKDGIRWELPNLGLLEHQGSKDNNLVFTAGRGEVAGGVFKDAIETDPERRYKMIYHLHGSPGLGILGQRHRHRLLPGWDSLEAGHRQTGDSHGRQPEFGDVGSAIGQVRRPHPGQSCLPSAGLEAPPRPPR